MSLVPCLDHPLLGHCTQPSATADLVATSSHLYPSLEDSASPVRSPRHGDDREAVSDSPPRGWPVTQRWRSLMSMMGGIKPSPLSPGSTKSTAQGTPELSVGSTEAGLVSTPIFSFLMQLPSLAHKVLLRVLPQAFICAGISTSGSASGERDIRHSVCLLWPITLCSLCRVYT